MEDSRGPSRATIARRRAVAIAVVAAVILVAVLQLTGGDGPADEPAAAPVSPETAAAIAGMAPEQLADQVLLLGFEGTDGSAEMVNDVRERELGGVLVGSANWADSDSGTTLVGAIRSAGREGGRIPPLLVAAQEGGRYRAFAELPPERTQLEIGDTGSAEAAEEWAGESAVALRSAGFDLNLFPVADVATLDSPIADRAFSDDVTETATLTAAALSGCRRAGLACAALHFPGLGAASEDTNRGPATVGLDAATLESRDLVPFTTAFAEGMPAVVLSLAFYVAYDPVTPGALSGAVVTGLLRDQLGYQGVAITDDLGAGAVRSGTSVAKAAVAALAAGADLLRIDAPADQAGVQAAIVDAVAAGELPQERLEQAAGRVLELKRSRGLLGGT